MHCKHSIKPDWLLSLIHLWGIMCVLLYAATKAIKKYGSDSHQVNRSRFLSSICPWGVSEARPDTRVVPAGHRICFPSQPLWSVFISTVIFSVILCCCWFLCPIHRDSNKGKVSLNVVLTFRTGLCPACVSPAGMPAHTDATIGSNHI